MSVHPHNGVYQETNNKTWHTSKHTRQFVCTIFACAEYRFFTNGFVNLLSDFDNCFRTIKTKFNNCFCATIL